MPLGRENGFNMKTTHVGHMGLFIGVALFQSTARRNSVLGEVSYSSTSEEPQKEKKTVHLQCCMYRRCASTAACVAGAPPILYVSPVRLYRNMCRRCTSNVVCVTGAPLMLYVSSVHL